MTAPEAEVDHVIILLPYKDITNPPSWLTDNFTISPGGRHADDKTENRLILFRDGSYLELIAFIDDDPERRKGHWWDKPYGIVDYSLTTASTEFDHEAINDRLAGTHSGISYAAPLAGGRTRPDGVKLEWKVTFPRGVERGLVPFWCHDVTPRERRVPITDASTTHPCRALGVLGVTVGVRADRVAQVDAALAAIVDAGGRAKRYALGAPRTVDGLQKPFLAVAETKGVAEAQRALTLQVAPGRLQESIDREIGSGRVQIGFEAT